MHFLRGKFPRSPDIGLLPNSAVPLLILGSSGGRVVSLGGASHFFPPALIQETEETDAIFPFQRDRWPGFVEEGSPFERGGPVDRWGSDPRGEGDGEDDGGSGVRGGLAPEAGGVGLPVRVPGGGFAVRGVPFAVAVGGVPGPRGPRRGGGGPSAERVGGPGGGEPGPGIGASGR